MQKEQVGKGTLLFQTVNTAVYQRDCSETFLFYFYGQQIEFRFKDLLTFRRKLQSINVIEVLTNDEADVEILNLPHCDRIIALPVIQILELQESLSGAFAMMELNRLIHKELVRKVV